MSLNNEDSDNSYNSDNSYDSDNYSINEDSELFRNNNKILNCCYLINNKMKKLLIKYYNTDVKIVEILFEYIDIISIKYNVSKDTIFNYKLVKWYYSNFLNALLTYMFLPVLFVGNLILRIDNLNLNDFKLSNVQIHDLIFHIYKLKFDYQP